MSDTASLARNALAAISARGVTIPRYALNQLTSSCVHVGPGAFHRVHQAWYFDALLASDPRWAITEVSLHSTSLRDALTPQQNLYTLAILDDETAMQVIGAIHNTWVAPENPERVIALMAQGSTRIITSTITEKGYCLNAQGELDWQHPDIRHDEAKPQQPVSYVGYLVAALARRHAYGVAAPNVISCDNLSHNGDKLRAAVIALASAHSAALAQWISDEVSFPNTMVDSITPATDAALRQRVHNALGVQDAWPVQREAFVQWVIEDTLRGDVPDLASVGVTLTRDVAAFERAKLRLLNGAHSSLAYLGLLAGHVTVRDAMLDTTLAQCIEQLMRQVIAPQVGVVPGLDVPRYIDSLLQRFRNPMLAHQLAQIAWDGSQKLPFRILDTTRDVMRHTPATLQSQQLKALTRPIAAWLHVIRRYQKHHIALIDPLADQLLAVASRCTGHAAHDVAAFAEITHVFTDDLRAHAGFQAALIDNYARLADVHDAASLARVLQAND